MKKLLMTMLCLLAGITYADAQVGYQIALLNTATGEARANETVKVSVSLSNNEGEVFYSETKSATTNDFGVLSLSIGNTDTFKDVDLSKMPFFIEVTANDVLIGKSQMLSVPVAEVAKKLAPIKQEDIIGTWHAEGAHGRTLTMSFAANWTCSSSGWSDESGTYFIQGNIICINRKNSDGAYYPDFALLHDGKLYTDSGVYSKQ